MTSFSYSEISEFIRDMFSDIYWHDDHNICSFCQNHIPCEGEKCSAYISGTGAESEDGSVKYPNYKWSCLDFDYGDCPMLECTDCFDCFKNHNENFVLDERYIHQKYGR